MSTHKPLTPLQRRLFFMALRPASKEVGLEPEAYRRRILQEELGVDSLSDVSRVGDFDKLMSRIWTDRGDYERALSYSMSSFSRVKYLIVKAAERIVAQKPDWRGSAYDYIAGVMRQSGMIPANTPRIFCDKLVSDAGWLDFSEDQMKRLLMMLNTQVRRQS